MPNPRTASARIMPMTTMSTSVSPGAVMNAGRWWDAAGLMDSAIRHLLSGLARAQVRRLEFGSHNALVPNSSPAVLLQPRRYATPAKYHGNCLGCSLVGYSFNRVQPR